MIDRLPMAWYPWVQILCKLVRALETPDKIDHWDDIIGYATLVRDELARRSAK